MVAMDRIRTGRERLERRQRADPEPALFLDVCQGLQGAKPNHETRPHEALLYKVDEASAAGDELRFITMLGQKRQCFIEV